MGVKEFKYFFGPGSWAEALERQLCFESPE